jgi:hypothetical protein
MKSLTIFLKRESGGSVQVGAQALAETLQRGS